MEPSEDRMQLAQEASQEALGTSLKRVLEATAAFTYHPPKGDQGARYQALRDAGRRLALQLLALVPPGRGQSQALTDLENCIMHANQGIAVGECGVDNPGVRLYAANLGGLGAAPGSHPPEQQDEPTEGNAEPTESEQPDPSKNGDDPSASEAEQAMRERLWAKENTLATSMKAVSPTE